MIEVTPHEVLDVVRNGNVVAHIYKSDLCPVNTYVYNNGTIGYVAGDGSFETSAALHIFKYAEGKVYDDTIFVILDDEIFSKYPSGKRKDVVKTFYDKMQKYEGEFL